MVFQNNVLLGASGSGTTTYTIDQSIRFNPSDNTYMHRTQDTADSKRKLSLSWWMKRGESFGTELCLFAAGASSRFMARMHSDDKLTLRLTNGTTEKTMTTDMVFRDPGAWYHCLWVADCTGGVSSEFSVLYVNGTRVSMTGTQPSADTDFAGYGDGSTFSISTNSHSLSSQEWDGYLAEMVLIDNQALDPSSFGEYNSSNIWIPKDVSGLTFGTNGFHIDGRDSADLGDDESGQGNDFTTSGLTSADQVSDSPSNNFATYNILNNYIGGHTFSEGNLKRVKNASKRIATLVTQGASSGKWYCECYSVTVSNLMLGIQAYEPDAEPEWPGNGVTDQGYGYYSSNGQRYINGSGAAYGNSWTNGDIIGIAMDLDNNKLYFSKNGTFQNSGDPTSGSTGTGAISITDPADTELGFYFFAFGDGSGTAAQTNVINCGQEGTFAGNTTAGGNSDGNGIGNFKYSVPSGYLALCTKNLGS